MGADDGVTLPLIEHDITRHVADRFGFNQQNGPGMGQVAELYRVEFGKILAAPVSDNFPDPAVASDPEIMFADRQLEFR